MATTGVAPTTVEEFEEQIRQIQAKKSGNVHDEEEPPENDRVGLTSHGHFDQEIYGGTNSKFEGYVTSIPANDIQDDDEDDYTGSVLAKRSTYTAPAALLNDIPQAEQNYDPFAEHRVRTIAEREDEYRARRRNLIISPERFDPFAEASFL